MHKIVNGQKVTLTSEEEIAILAEWTENEPTLQSNIDAAKAAEDEAQWKAIRRLALLTMKEINILRAEHSLPLRTEQQLKNAFKGI